MWYSIRCFCKPEQGLCTTHKNNPCSRSIEEPQRPEFPQSYFGVIFVTDAFCDKDGCEGRIVVSEKYRDDKNGGRSREDLVMGLTQHMTVIIVPEESKWAQVFQKKVSILAKHDNTEVSPPSLLAAWDRTFRGRVSPLASRWEERRLYSQANREL